MKIALFDFDGTLADSMPAWGQKVSRLLSLQGIPVPKDFLNIATPLGDGGTVQYILSHYPENRLTVAEMQAEMDAYALPKYRDEIPAKAGVAAYLAKLHEEGVGIYLLTASPRKMFLPCLTRLGLAPYFTEAWCTEDFGLVKSDPTIYRAVAERIGVSTDDITFFDDNRTALETAKRAGCHVIGVYDDTSSHDEAAIRAISDGYIHSFCELL